MEDVYTVKVKTKPDTRNLYPSERRYSASTVSGLAWVHIALAATSFLLACLALINPDNDHTKLSLTDTDRSNVDSKDFIHNVSVETTTEFGSEEIVSNNTEYSDEIVSDSHMLVIAPSLLTVFALAAGLASIMASVRWYIDRNITWVFLMSILSTIVSFSAFIMIAVYLGNTSQEHYEIQQLFKDKFKEYFIVKHKDVIHRNDSHLVISLNPEKPEDNTGHLFTKKVLSINILIAAFLEFLWSILSVKISYKGMRNNYKDDDSEPRGNCIAVVTTIKGNNAKRYPRNGKLMPPKPDLIEHYPNKKIKRIFLANGDNGFYLKNQNANDKCTKENTETSSELYKERMMNFLNRCGSVGGASNPDMSASVHSEAVLNTIPETDRIQNNKELSQSINDLSRSRDTRSMTPISWGDTPDHTIYNQNNIPIENLFRFGAKINQEGGKTKQDGGKEKSDNRREELNSVEQTVEVGEITS